MTRHVPLNNVEHKNLRVITRSSAQFGDNVGGVVIFPTEFREVQREYPIFFRKEPGTDDYLSVALLGFAKDENLFLDGSGWNARYIPAVVARGPFLIGFQDESPVIHLDLDHPRVSETEGEPLFLATGRADALSAARGGRARCHSSGSRAQQGDARGIHRARSGGPPEARGQVDRGPAPPPAWLSHRGSPTACGRSTRPRSSGCTRQASSRAHFS